MTGSPIETAIQCWCQSLGLESVMALGFVPDLVQQLTF